MYVKGQAPAITAPGTITFTQGVSNSPVQIINTGGAVPSKVYGQPVEVKAGLPELLRTMVKSPDGNFYGAGVYTSGIFKISPGGEISLYAGGTNSGYLDGPLLSAKFDFINNIVADASGNLYVTEINQADGINSRIRKISTDGMVSTFASGLRNPAGLAIDASGSIYVTEASWIRKYSPSGAYTIFAGKLGPGFENGQGTNASFSDPRSLVFDTAGNLFVSEAYYGLRKITPEGMVTLHASVFPSGKMVIDAAGNFYVNTTGGAVYKVTPGSASWPLLHYGAMGLILDDGELYYTGGASGLYRMPIFGYGIESALPRGLVLNGDGTISGTPSYPGGPWIYTITAYNTSGISTAKTEITTTIQPVAPTVTSFTPDSAVAGQWITIKGSHFFEATGVQIGGVPAQSFQVYDFDLIRAMMGPGTPSGEVTITNAYGSGSLPGFKLIPPPVITSFSPETAPRDSVVTITGENFSSAFGVTFGYNGAASFTVVSPTKILARLGMGSSGIVTVHSPAGTGSKPGFVFIAPPEISSFTPSGGAGSEVLIQGSGFLGATNVTFGGTDAASFTVLSATSIKAIPGTGSSGDVTVTGPGGIATKAGFMWVEAPVITSFFPSSAGQGDQVMIIGSNLQNVKSVLFGGVPATYMTSSPTAIFAYVGIAASGDITISTPGGSASLAGFTFLPPPAITSFAPASGHKGDIITISGANFTSGASVWFGNVQAGSVKVLSETTIEAEVGLGASGSITVRDAGGSSMMNGFVHTGPDITGISPLNGGTGTFVTISGHNFTDITAIYFGGLPVASFTLNSPESITVVVGPGQSGKISIDGKYGTALSSMEFEHSGPTISALGTNQGYAGSTVMIGGTRLTGVTAVSFGGVAASFTVITDNLIKAVLGSDGASGNVLVESPAGTASRSGFTYIFPPLITSYNPTSGGPDQVITITGSNFYNVSVKIGDTPVYPVQYSPTNIQVPVPLNAIDGVITVSTPAGTATAGPFHHTGPKILGFEPSEAIAGQEIIISGENLQNVTSVNFGPFSVSSFSIISSTRIKAIVPESAGNEIEVRNAQGFSSLQGFSIINPPQIFSFNPLNAGAGTPVSISGTNFRYVNSVSFGGVPAQSFVVESPTKIIAIPAEGASGAIEVITDAGTASYAGFSWFPKPMITSFSPARAGTGDILTITGTNLNGATSVKFGSIASGGYNATSPTSISVLVPNGESGDITVTTPGGTTSIAGFTHIPAPTISAFTQSGEGEFQTVHISGTNFDGASAVTFGEVAANSFTVQSATEIIAIAGSTAIGTIRVRTPGGTAQKAGFIFQEPPYINTFSPETGPVGTRVTITGTNFNLNAPDNKVYFGTIGATVISAAENELVVIVPAGIANQPIRVLNADTKLTGTSARHFRLTFTQSIPVTAELFTAKTELLFQDPLDELKMADLDGDGMNDLVVMTGKFTNSQKIIVFRNGVKEGIAAASFADTTIIPANGISSYSLGDLNGDGTTDIFYSGTQMIFLKNISSPGSISFEPDSLAPGVILDTSEGFRVKDVDLDGKNDIVAQHTFFLNTSLFSPTRSLSFGDRKVVPFFVNSFAYSVSTEDLDDDRRPDFVLSHPYGLAALKNLSTPGDISDLSVSQLNLPSPYYNTDTRVIIEDIDGDQRPDIIQQDAVHHSFAILRNQHTTGMLSLASFSPPRTFYLGGSWDVAPEFADMDGDSKTDIVSIHQSSIKMLKNMGSPGVFGWEEKNLFSTGTYPGSVHLSALSVGDLDGDGKPELVTVNATNYKIIILHSNPALAPQITGFSPAAAPAGATVTVTGNNLLSTTSVSFGGQPAASFKVTSSTSLTAVVGVGASGDVSVINHADTALKSGFTFIPQPEIISFSPAVAVAGTTVTITGKNFKDVTAVSFGGTPAASFTVLSPETITAVAGRGASGAISIMTPGGSASKDGITFLPLPVITADGQTTFVTGGSVVLNAAPSSGYTYNWTRDGLIIPGATSASLTVTQSGSYAASIELNSVKSNSNAIDVKAVYVLPVSNFKVQVTGESCKAGENGSVKITAEQGADYTVTIKGNNKDAAYKFSASHEIQNLTAGTYQLCITVADQPDFSRCFEVTVTEPKDLSLISFVDISRKMLALRMEGGTLFHIELNGNSYETSGTNIELPLIAGRNQLELWTDKDCQGKISRIIELDPEQMVFPNPVESTLNIRAGNNKPAIIEIRDMQSRLIYSGRHECQDGLYKVDVRTLAPGVYVLQTQIENRIENFRIIKQ